MRAADAFPPAPAQGGTALGGGATMTFASDEDCLYLNLFTPALDGARPVIVWIYGGGFEVGTASPPMTDVAALGRATGTVVVAMNYRVGALGWLHLADLGGPDWAGSTNLGLQDQIAALHWVRANIAAFGGDPGNITVAGESAGAFSIGALLAARAAAGTFHRAHPQQRQHRTGLRRRDRHRDRLGPAGRPRPRLGQGARRRACRPAARRRNPRWSSRTSAAATSPAGAPGASCSTAACLIAIPTAAVAGGRRRPRAACSSAPTATRRRCSRSSPASPRPAMTHCWPTSAGPGSVSPPDSWPPTAPVTRGAGLTELRTRFLSDAIYLVPANRLAQAQVEAGGAAYRAVFAPDPFGPEVGTPHGLDIAYIFDLLDART